MTNELIGVIEDGAQIVSTIVDPQPVIQVDLIGSGPPGKQGKVWTPEVDEEEGLLTWHLDDGQTQPEPANIKGPPGDPAEIDYDELAEKVDVTGLTTYMHGQAVPAKIWEIEHGLGFYPSVTVTTYAGTKVYGTVEYVDSNNLIVEFAVDVAGFCHLS